MINLETLEKIGNGTMTLQEACETFMKPYMFAGKITNVLIRVAPKEGLKKEDVKSENDLDISTKNYGVDLNEIVESLNAINEEKDSEIARLKVDLANLKAEANKRISVLEQQLNPKTKKVSTKKKK